MMALILLLFTMDQLTKYLIRASLDLYQSVPVVAGFFHLTYTQNTGGVFGIFPERTLFFSLGAILLLLLLSIFIYFFHYPFLQRLGLFFIMGGALGNLFDRLYFGYVTDFLDFRIWPVFNLADLFVVCGVLLFLVKEYLLYREKGDTK